MAIRQYPFIADQIEMETGQTTWNQGSLIAHATVTATDVQAGRLATSPSDTILGVYAEASPAVATSAFEPDRFPLVTRWGTGIPMLVEASATIALNDLLVASSVTNGTVRTAAAGEVPIGRALTAVTVGAAANIVMADLFPPFQMPAGALGTAGTGTTAVEVANGPFHRTTLTVAGVLPAITGGVNQAVGLLLYTFPAGVIAIHGAHMSLAITQTEGNITADTPDGGLGTVIGTGAVATLDGTATFENILTGQTFNDCNGTAETIALGPTAGTVLMMNAADAHTVHFNAADGWAAGGDVAAAVAGTVVLHWTALT